MDSYHGPYEWITDHTNGSRTIRMDHGPYEWITASRRGGLGGARHCCHVVRQPPEAVWAWAGAVRVSSFREDQGLEDPLTKPWTEDPCLSPRLRHGPAEARPSVETASPEEREGRGGSGSDPEVEHPVAPAGPAGGGPLRVP
jgi:hypothetical protein